VDIRALARARLDNFLQDIGAEIVRSGDLPMSDLVEAYFQPAPPFSAAGKNKAEFPDAIALLSLARWASDTNSKVLAVSSDRGWRAYSDLHEWIELRDELADALSLLQKHAEEARAVIHELLKSIDKQTPHELIVQFEALLQNELSSYDAYGDAESLYSVGPDRLELELVEFRFVEDEEDYVFSVVQSGPHILAAEVALGVSVRAETTFYMAVYDSIDKDYTPAGSTVAKTEKELDFKALVTFERDEDTAPFRLSKLELVDGPDTIEFGFVEPDYEPEPDEHYEMPDDRPDKRDETSPFGNDPF
jgi:hypothetical protein